MDFNKIINGVKKIKNPKIKTDKYFKTVKEEISLVLRKYINQADEIIMVTMPTSRVCQANALVAPIAKQQINKFSI